MKASRSRMGSPSAWPGNALVGARRARRSRSRAGGGGDHNAWRRGKALIQVAVPEEIHVELSVLAKRRRINMSRLVKDALNDWLAAHGQALRIPD